MRRIKYQETIAWFEVLNSSNQPVEIAFTGVDQVPSAIMKTETILAFEASGDTMASALANSFDMLAREYARRVSMIIRFLTELYQKSGGPIATEEEAEMVIKGVHNSFFLDRIVEEVDLQSKQQAKQSKGDRNKNG